MAKKDKKKVEEVVEETKVEFAIPEEVINGTLNEVEETATEVVEETKVEETVTEVVEEVKADTADVEVTPKAKKNKGGKVKFKRSCHQKMYDKVDPNGRAAKVLVKRFGL